MLKQLRAVTSALCIASVAACGGGGDHSAAPSVTIGGTVSGLVGKLVLQDNAGDNLSISANGAFTFATPINQGAAYAVTILTQPPGPTCVVSNGSGTATTSVTSVSVTCTADPATVFLPMSATDVDGPPIPGLFVISSKSPGDPPIQITTEDVDPLGLQAQYTVGARGTVGVGNLYSLIYATLNPSSGNHVWSLNLSGTSPLIPTQLSNLTLPYYTTYVHGGTTAVQYCKKVAISKNLADPSTAFLILALPTDPTSLCGSASLTSWKWLLIHSSDGPTTDPVTVPALSGPILPLYRPDGTLAGLVTIDASNHNLNFYPDETFTNPRLLLANVSSFTPNQEAPAARISGISANPTYGFLVVNSPSSIYRIDYSGAISADLYDFGVAQEERFVVDSGNLYFTAVSETTTENRESVVEISGGAGPVQTLSSTSLRIGGGGAIPSLEGISGSHLVFTGATPQQQSNVQTLSIDAPGPFTTIASSNTASPDVSLVGGDVFVTWFDFHSSPGVPIQYSSQILDDRGNVLQASTSSSVFVSHGAPVMQVRNIADTGSEGGGGVYLVDLSQPSSPTPVPLKTATGTAFNLPSGVDDAYFRQVTPTIGVADSIVVQSGRTAGALVYDLATGVVVPVSMPNLNWIFLSIVVPAAN